MTELSVRVQYQTRTRKVVLSLLKGTFPLWGLGAPLVGGAGLVFLIGVIATSPASLASNGAQVFQALFGVITLLTAFLTGLFLTNWLSRDCLIVDKDGLQLPLNPWNTRRAVTWQALSRVEISPAGANDWRQQQIVLFSPEKKPLRIGLADLASEQIEQMLLGIEMWAKGCDVDSSVQDLKRGINKRSNESVNYTQMWEDELRSRFAAVNFIPLEPGQMLRNGSLRLVRQMALGGLSAVYLCQLDEKKLVALKEAVVSEDSTEAAQAKAREMLDRESALLLKLDHRGVVKVMDHFVEQGRNYLMLEYIDGQDLRQLVRQNGPQRDSIVIEWAVQLASILKYLHEQDPPLIHRDFTPDNLVLREDGSLVVIDFGAANEFIGTATGTFVGKQSFIAPEQFRGKAVVQSDIYAFGCTLFFLLTGQEPEALSTSNPAEVNQYINKELCDLVVACTQMEAQDRYQTASQLLPVLKGLAASLPTLN